MLLAVIVARGMNRITRVVLTPAAANSRIRDPFARRTSQILHSGKVQLHHTLSVLPWIGKPWETDFSKLRLMNPVRCFDAIDNVLCVDEGYV